LVNSAERDGIQEATGLVEDRNDPLRVVVGAVTEDAVIFVETAEFGIRIQCVAACDRTEQPSDSVLDLCACSWTEAYISDQRRVLAERALQLWLCVWTAVASKIEEVRFLQFRTFGRILQSAFRLLNFLAAAK